LIRVGSRIFGPGPEISWTLISLEPEIGIFQFCVTRLVNIPIFSRGSFPDPDSNMDRSTCPYHQSRIPCRPIHRHGPSAVPKAFPREYQVDDENHLQSKDVDRNVRCCSTLAFRHRFCHFTISLASSEKCLPRPRAMTRRIL